MALQVAAYVVGAIIITTILGLIVTDITVHMILNRKYMEEDTTDKLRKMFDEIHEDKE